VGAREEALEVVEALAEEDDELEEKGFGRSGCERRCGDADFEGGGGVEGVKTGKGC